MSLPRRSRRRQVQERPVERRTLVGRWVLAPLGLLLVGAGLSVTVDAGVRRGAGAPARRWAGQGTAGLVTLNSGLSVLGDAVRRAAQAP